MWRFIFLGLVIWLAIHFFKRHIGQPRRGQSDTKESTPETNASQNKDQDKEIESMVLCATCAVHLPRSEAFLVADKFYCCKAHIQHK